MSTLSELQKICREKNVTLVAVSKTHPPERILTVYDSGQRVFGENRVQELLEKYEQLPKDIQWHLIGHLQTNKVKYITPFVALVHSVDSARLLAEINKYASKNQRVIDCLLQFHIASEETKFGFSEAEADDLLQSDVYREWNSVRIVGVMGMASFSQDQHLVRSEFRHLHGIFTRLQQTYFADKPWFREISMGMSGDWAMAVEEGSTMIRVGSLIFGQRG